jgi:hypothetical protein
VRLSTLALIFRACDVVASGIRLGLISGIRARLAARLSRRVSGVSRPQVVSFLVVGGFGLVSRTGWLGLNAVSRK